MSFSLTFDELKTLLKDVATNTSTTVLETAKANKEVIAASCAASTVLVAWILNNIKRSGPHHRLAYILTRLLSKPCVKSGGSKIDDPDPNLTAIKDTLSDYILNGEDIGTQFSLWIDNKEILNYYAVDENVYPDYNESSLTLIYSSTKNVAAMLTSIAVNNGWIKSYDDEVIEYWPKFPTKARYLYKDKKTGNIAFESISDDKRLHICDILRHESGLDIFYQPHKQLYFSKTDYKTIKNWYETAQITWRKVKDPIIQSNRQYHGLTRGFLLNELFHRVEPKNRYMSEYFDQEITPILSKNDTMFGFHLKGVRKEDMTRQGPVYHVHHPSNFWMFYHFLIPFITGIRKFWLGDKHYYSKYNELYNTDIEYCNLNNLKYLLKIIDPISPGTCGLHDYAPEWFKGSNWLSLSKKFENYDDLAMEWMSGTGISNAHSMGKFMSYILFDTKNNEITNDYDKTLNEMIDKSRKAFDINIFTASNFTQGGFHEADLFGIKWYMWGGIGGSIYAFSPKYKCVFSYLIMGYQRMDVGVKFGLDEFTFEHEPRMRVLFKLVADYLKSL